MRKLILLMCAVFVVAHSAAMAAKPSHPTTPSNSNANSNANTSTTTTAKGKSAGAKVIFVLHGTVTTYNAGSGIQIALTGANRDRSALTPNSKLSLTLDSHTKIVLHDGAAVAGGDKVLVKVRAAKKAQTSDLTSTPAFQIIDQGKRS